MNYDNVIVRFDLCMIVLFVKRRVPYVMPSFMGISIFIAHGTWVIPSPIDLLTANQRFTHGITLSNSIPDGQLLNILKLKKFLSGQWNFIVIKM